MFNIGIHETHDKRILVREFFNNTYESIIHYLNNSNLQWIFEFTVNNELTSISVDSNYDKEHFLDLINASSHFDLHINLDSYDEILTNFHILTPIFLSFKQFINNEALTYFPLNNDALLENNEPDTTLTDRKSVILLRIIRDSQIAIRVKVHANYSCQLCETRIDLGNNNFYIEAHHIRPLGNPHNGPDIIENMIAVCPNCHIKCDYRSMPLDLTQIINSQNISQEFIDYHNNLQENNN